MSLEFAIGIAVFAAVLAVILLAWNPRNNQPVSPHTLPTIAPDLYLRVQQLVERRQAIEAIKLVRSETHASLRAAKGIVDAVGAGMYSANGSPVATTSGDEETFTAFNGQKYSSRIRNLALRGKKIEALKALRAEANLNLKQAKEIVDRIV